MPESKNERLFIAISISEDTIRFLRDLQCKLKQKKIRASWTSEKNMHLTLKFLGDTPSGFRSIIIEGLQEAVSVASPFFLYAGSLGVFPSVKKPRVLWSKVKGDTEKLESLYSSVETRLAFLGFEIQRNRFHPHLTIGRTKGRIPSQLMFELIEQFSSLRSETFHVTGVHLFKSELKPEGAVHTRLFTAELPFSCENPKD